MRTLFTLSVLLLLLSCTETTEKKKTLAESKGLPSEILLVVDKAVWESDLQDSVKLITDAPVPGLSQAENFFRVTQIFTQYYDRSFSSMHSKLFVHIDPALQKPMIGVNRNVTARPQIEVTISAPNREEMRGFLSRNVQRIQDLINEEQLQMRLRPLKRKYSKRIADDASRVLGLTVRVPENLIASKRGKNFLWGGTNTNQKDQNVVLYTYPWDGTDIMNVEHFVEKRDSVMQANIPGEREGQWMQTARYEGRPILVSRERTIGGNQVFEVRGLWEMRQAPLGGPFVSLTRIDTLHRKVIVSEAFVYSPSTEKRELLRTMEAALRTVSIR